jgi:hypothetical protein
MEIKQIINGIKVYAPIAVSRLYENRAVVRSARRRLVQTEKVRRVSSWMNGKK